MQEVKARKGKILNETNRELEPSDIPCENYWLRGIESWEDLKNIGGNNIRALISICRRYEGYRRDSIKENKYFSEFGQEDDRKRLIIIRRCIKGLQGFLKEMSESDLEKPYLPHLRRNDLFQIGDRVVALLPYPQEGMYVPKINRKLKDKDWVMATVVGPEMEAQFHTVVPKYPKKTVVCLTDIPLCGSVAGGVDPRYQMFKRNDHEIIPEDEFMFFRERGKDFLEIWINNISPREVPDGLRERIRSGKVVTGRQKKPWTYKKTPIKKLAKEFREAGGNSEDQKAILVQMGEIAEEFDELIVLVDTAGENSEDGLSALRKMLDIDLDFDELHRMHVSWLELYSDLQKVTSQRMLEKAEEASEYCIVYSIAPDLEDVAWERILQIHIDSKFEEWRLQVSFSVRKNSPELERLVFGEMVKRAETMDDWATLYHDSSFSESNLEIKELAWERISEMTETCAGWMKVCHNPYMSYLWQRPFAEAKKVCVTKEDKVLIDQFES